jgi:hypothetical protein
LAQADDLTAADHVQADVSRWVAMAIGHVIGRRVNVVWSATLGRPASAESKIVRFRRAGYRVEIAVVAVDDIRSRLGALRRYRDEHDTFGIGRYVPPDVQSQAYNGLLDAIGHIERGRLVDAVHVYARTGPLLYTNQRMTAGWEDLPAAGAAIEAERGRLWTLVEVLDVIAILTELQDSLRHELRGELDEIIARTGERLVAEAQARGVSAERAAETWARVIIQRTAP